MSSYVRASWCSSGNRSNDENLTNLFEGPGHTNGHRGLKMLRCKHCGLNELLQRTCAFFETVHPRNGCITLIERERGEGEGREGGKERGGRERGEGERDLNP